jgi:hypothetical protein
MGLKNNDIRTIIVLLLRIQSRPCVPSSIRSDTGSGWMLDWVCEHPASVRIVEIVGRGLRVVKKHDSKLQMITSGAFIHTIERD